jgi:cell division protein FtsX
MTASVRAEPPLLPAMGGLAPGVTLALALFSFLASAELVAATTAVRAVQAWPERLAGDATLAVAGAGIESADAAAARAVDRLERDPRIARAWVIEPSPQDGLIARIIGAPPSGPDDGAPRLVGYAARPGARLEGAEVVAGLRAEHIGAAIDDHRPWSGPLERAGLAAAGGAAALLLACLALVFATVALGVRDAVQAREERVALLVRLGAADQALTRPFSRRLYLSALAGSLIGAIAVAAIAAILSFSPEAAVALAARGLPVPAIDAFGVVSALAWLPLAWAASAWAAGSAARAALRPYS